MNANTTDDRIDELEKRIEKLEKLVVGPKVAVARAKKLSAREFLMRVPVKSETQKVLALGYFLEHMEGMASFNISDLEAAFRAAKEKPPTNMNDVVNKNMARGLLMEAESKKESKKAWCLTATGEKHLEGTLGA